VPWLTIASLSLRRPGSVHVGFVVDEVALARGQVFLQVLQSPLSVSFHYGSPYSYINWGMNSKPVGGCSSRHQHEHEAEEPNLCISVVIFNSFAVFEGQIKIKTQTYILCINLH
jgi:hypothetical protein